MGEQTDADRAESLEGSEILDKLLSEIAVAEAELEGLKEQIKNQGEIFDKNGGAASVTLEARLLQEETKLMKKSNPETFDDEQIQYFLAVGHIEEQGAELRQLNEYLSHSLTENGKRIDQLNQLFAEQAELTKSLKEELAASEAMEDDKSEDEQTIAAKRKVEGDIRQTRKVLKYLKGFLKDFIENTAKLDPSYQKEEGASIGYLLQALWSSFLQKGGHRDYVHIESLQYDVQDKDVQQLAAAGILQTHPQDPKKIRMVDFTMRS